MPKNKKIFAICFFALQLLIIAGLIAYSALFSFFFEIFGREYKIKAKPSMYVTNGVCYYDLDTGYWYTGKVYIVPDEQTGEYTFSSNYYAPLDAVDYFYCRRSDTDSFPRTQKYQLKNSTSELTYYSFEQENTFVTVKAFNGKCEVTAVECDGIPIEEYLTIQEEYFKTESLF